MSNVNFRKEKIKNKGFKYNIFNVMFLFCFFMFAVVGGKIISAAESVTVHQSNSQGNNGDASILGLTPLGKNAYYNKDGSGNPIGSAYVQTTGKTMKDTVSFTVVMEMDKESSSTYKIVGEEVHAYTAAGTVKISTIVGDEFAIGTKTYTRDGSIIKLGATEVATVNGSGEFTIKAKNTINGVTVFETGVTESGTTNYDSYKKDTYGTWDTLVKDASDNKLGYVASSVSGFVTSAAGSTELNANNSSKFAVSWFYLNEETDSDKITVTLYYVYTLRSSGWGTKTINISLYNDSAYDEYGNVVDPTHAKFTTLSFVASKPINQFEETVIDASGETCGSFTVEDGRTPAGNITLNDICITYVNDSTMHNNDDGRPMTFVLPKEVAYKHIISSGDTIENIKKQSIYCINTFTNAGTTDGKVVKYYYWNYINNTNAEMNPASDYEMTLMVDATGGYVFYIRDVFGNQFTSSQITVSDIEINNIIVDHTGAAGVNIMSSTGTYASGWRQAWSFTVNVSDGIKYDNMVEDQVQVVFHIFQKKVITLGKFEGASSTVEDIVKQPHSESSVTSSLGYEARVNKENILVWRINDVAADTGDASSVISDSDSDGNYVEHMTDGVSCEAGTAINCQFAVGEYGDGVSKNKVTFTVTNNGRYRVMITDTAGNTTNTTKYNQKNASNVVTEDYTNPKVEVSVIDRTDPVIYTTLTDNKTSIKSYKYVIGGGNGETDVINPNGVSDVASLGENYYTTGDYSAIYYNKKGTAAFTYQDALEIAKVYVVDDVYYNKTDLSKNNKFASYEVSFNKETDATSGLNLGKYTDPGSAYKSDRATGGNTAYNLHDYIINNQITSFSGGLVKKVGYTQVANASINEYSQINESSADLTYVPGSATSFYSSTNFLGYLAIEFQIKISSGYETVCSVSIDSTKDNASTSDATNQACFEKMNKIIDDVEDFKMIFSATDFVGNNSNDTAARLEVSVAVVDTTKPGFYNADPAVDNTHPIKYTNTYSGSTCRLEIGVAIQEEKTLLDCYGISNGSNFYIVDNNVYSADNKNYNSAASGDPYAYNMSDKGVQYYGDGVEVHKYINKIKTYVKEGEGSFTEIGTNTVLNKSGDHMIKLEISDHWKTNLGLGTKDNVLVVIINYYVNPKTVLIEPLANEKMYGEDDPTLEYCVYINKTNSSFYYEGNFFDKDFINTYFYYIYCTKDVYVEMDSSSIYSASTENTATAGYKYTTFTAASGLNVATNAVDGKYLKVNNTYVKILGAEDAEINNMKLPANRYTRAYTADANGNYFGYDSDGNSSIDTYQKILSGNKYTTDECAYSYTGNAATGYFLRTAHGCKEVTSGSVYKETFTPSATGTFLKYNNVSVDKILVSGDSFAGKLARVESSCYNAYGTIDKDSTQEDIVLDDLYVDSNSRFNALVGCVEQKTDSTHTRNDNVGQYNIVLGSLSISRTSDSTNYNKDYVIKINTNYWSEGNVTDDTTVATNKKQTTATKTNYDNAKSRDITVGGKLVDDEIKEESTVKFTIRQAVLTVKANGGSKIFGEQDSYSNVWSNTSTVTNNAGTGYLSGYTISGWRNDDDKSGAEVWKTKDIVLGTLRRGVGEEVGTYRICNISSNPSDTSKLGSGCSADYETVGLYDSTSFWYFTDHGRYTTGGATTSAALTINTNGNIYGTTGGRKVNTGTTNYAIVYIGEIYTINPGTITIQPGVNQGKEYSATAYSDPYWQYVIYGETINNSTGSWVTNIDVASGTDSFNGYTAKYDVETYTTYSQGQTGTRYASDTEIYFARRKTSPDVAYTYEVPVTITAKYVKTGNVYYRDDANGTYIYAFGNYHSVTGAVGGSATITVVGRLVNQTYTMFSDDFKTEINVIRESGETVGWYKYNAIDNITTKSDNTTNYYTLKQHAKTECVIADNSVTVATTGTRVNCTNYNVLYTDIAPETVPDTATTEAQITGYKTKHVTTRTELYKPNGLKACNVVSGDNSYSSTCDTADANDDSEKYQILFEIFKREIHLEFIDYNYTFVYGNRYDWYKTNIFDITSSNGKNTTAEGDIFLCYSDLGDYVVNCTTDNDYGLTKDDTWSNIGLEFHLHSSISDSNSPFYDTGSDYAVPAGMYYVYASIKAAASANYLFVYRGGTLKVNPKVTSVELTGYTMEYGENYYTSYGTGTDYTNYTLQADQCRKDSKFATSADTLIENESSCSITTANEHGNIYGFVVEGLDSKDTIAENFKGRPTRASGSNVGMYAISVNTIANIKNTNITNTYKECEALDGETCTFVKKTADGKNTTIENAMNYDISYSLTNNEGSYLFITPAKITIEVLAGQTKMYGCAYYRVITDHETYYDGYSYESGYTDTNCESDTDAKLDMAYKYTVYGDKDAGGEYTVETDTTGTWKTSLTGGKTSSLNDTTRLYRILKESDNTYDFSSIRNQVSLYQGQAVGVYVITLGNLDVKTNGNNKCDDYNNPAANGTNACKNYNINYYGNSTSIDAAANNHTYTEADKEVAVADLALYTLNYQADNNGSYVLINGKFVDVSQFKTSDTKVIVNDYIDISAARYKKLAQYEIISEASCTDDSACYIKVDLDSTDANPATYMTIASLSAYRYPSATGGTQSSSGTYLKVGSEYIKLSSITKFKRNYADGAAESSKYATDNSGAYVLVNGSYVEWADLIRYKATTADGVTTYTSGTDTIANGFKYVLGYKTVEVSTLQRYSLDVSNDTKTIFASGASVGKNVYAYINGSYVPYASLTINDGKVTVNSAKLSDASTSAGTVTTDINFTIIARKVFVHTEFNIKAYSEAERAEFIKCSEIAAAYGLTTDKQKSLRTYCNFNDSTSKVDMGVSMYYAVQNSLAKAPWTAWTDGGSRQAASAGGTDNYSGFNDIQYDVLSGQLKRATGEIAGKYTFDFSSVTNVGTLNGKNYMIVHITEMDNGTTKTKGNGTTVADGDGMENTYIANGVKLSSKMYESCTWGTDYCASDSSGNPIRIKMNAAGTALDFTLKADNDGNYNESTGSATSISLINKYSASSADINSKITYWHLGFYKEDSGSDRAGELATWWNMPNGRAPFSTSYDTFKSTNNTGEGGTGEKIQDPYFANDRPVYYEIVKRTIYLYAVDTEKIYGEQDKYSDFLVAICPNNQGYVVNGDGTISCKSDDTTGSAFASAYGLGDADKAKFVPGGKMDQNKIRGISSTDDYLISGTPSATESFGIYFRRTVGEDAGVYSVTACATQSDVVDCTDPNLTEQVNTPVNYIGDNYKIIEISGVLTIKTREIKVTPDSGQGFQYGNYTEDGSMPNITFTESHEHGTDSNSANGLDATGNGLVFGSGGVYLIAEDGTKVQVTNNTFEISSTTYKIDGIKVVNQTTKVVDATITVTNNSGINTKTLTIGGKTYTIVQKARCLVNISGLSIVCINDAQNEKIAGSSEFVGKTAKLANANYYDFVGISLADLATQTGITLYNGSTAFVPENTTLTYTSYNVYGDAYSNPANHTTRTEANSNSALDLLVQDNTNGTYTISSNKYKTGYRFSRDVGTYTIGKGSLTISNTSITVASAYVKVTVARLYSDEGLTTPNSDGPYLKVGNQAINISSLTKYKYVCTDTDPDENVTNFTCSYQTASGSDTDVYVKIDNAANVNANYSIKSVVETITYSITPADIKVTPGERQYKIYGEADVEIEFTVETTYTVANTHYSDNATNIKQICNGATCYTDLTSYKDGEGNVLLTAGWIVTLNNYAYKEYTNNAGTTEAAGNLDYGENTTATKHGGTESSLSQATSGADHYDKYTNYNATIDTSRILIGNLYVADWDQTVGEKAIKGDKIIVAKNALGEKNYTYDSTAAKHYESKLFVIVPRPVNVQITNVTKTYGQATDSTSCETYDTSCIVGDGILDISDSTNNSLLTNNFTIVSDITTNNRTQMIASGPITVNSKNVTGIQVIYYKTTDTTDAQKLAKMNMPTVKTTAGTVYNSYATIASADANKYYTADGEAETKNADLDIEVNRENKNIARDSDTCLVTTDVLVSGTAKGCEDVGEYYLKFVKKLSTTNVIEPTLVTSGTVGNSAYGNSYWGYNPNYYVIVYKNFEASGWTADNGSTSYTSLGANTSLLYAASGTDNTTPAVSATLKIRKRPIEIVVETINDYVYKKDTVGDGTGTAIAIGERNFLKVGTSDYLQITRTNVYRKDGTKFIQLTLADLTAIPTGSYLCTYAANNANAEHSGSSGNCYAITDANRYKREAKTVGDKYNIEQSMHVPQFPEISNSESVAHTTYKNITWNEHDRQVRTADVLVGEVAYCNTTESLGTGGLDALRSKTCTGTLKYWAGGKINDDNQTEFFSTAINGYYTIVRQTNKLYIGSSASMNGTDGQAYEANNYNTTFINGILQVDLDTTPPVITVERDFVSKEANGGVMSLSGQGTELKTYVDILTANACNTIKDNETTCSATFIYENATYASKGGGSFNASDPTTAAFLKLIEWFGIKSFDPSVMRENEAVPKTYYPRWYMSIGYASSNIDYDQRKVGDYTIFIYAEDNVGIVSLATTVTLRIVDTTKPTVGTLNLYDAEVSCDFTNGCNSEEGWNVANDTYLPILSLDESLLSNDIKAKKYIKVNGEYHLNNDLGTYYLIPAGTSASSVKHRGWTNAENGIYLTVTGGDDNSLNYLDISKYDRYTVNNDGSFTKGSGYHILLGNLIDVSHLTKYREVKLTSGEEVSTGSTIVYIPDVEGTIIKYKGYYYDLSTGNYVGLDKDSHSTNTAPTDPLYTVKMFKLASGTYTSTTTATRETVTEGSSKTEYKDYYLVDGSFYDIKLKYLFEPTGADLWTNYARDYCGSVESPSGECKYIAINQWDNYYSRDGGNSWVKIDRESYRAPLALNEDGQRLIMTKAVDVGFTFGSVNVDKELVRSSTENKAAAYCDSLEGGFACDKWNKVETVSGTYAEANGAKVMKYNISDWAEYSATGSKDVKYAYLDTIAPDIALANKFIEVYEYGCTTCTVNYTEEFGTAIDGYVFNLNNLVRYDSSGKLSAGGGYVKINGQLIQVESSRLYKKEGTVYTKDATGSYIYLGRTDAVVSIDKTISEQLAAYTSRSFSIFDQVANQKKDLTLPTTASFDSSNVKEKADVLKANTKELSSGLGTAKNTNTAAGVGGLFAGVSYENKTFGNASNIGDNYTKIDVYVDVRTGSGNITGNTYLDAAGYYKFKIESDGAATPTYTIKKCYSSSANIGVEAWCGSPSTAKTGLASMAAAVQEIATAYKSSGSGNSIDFKGHDITITIDYRVFDLAGNASQYVRKAVLLTSFTRTIVGINGAGGAVASSLSVDLAQNSDPMVALSQFEITSANGNNIRADEKITQTIYYNGIVVAENQDYDLTALANLDTTVPGTYKVVYSIARRDGLNYVQGNSVELLVNIKPDMATINGNNIDYKQIILTSFVAVSAILIFAYVYMSSKKRKFN